VPEGEIVRRRDELGIKADNLFTQLIPLTGNERQEFTLNGRLLADPLSILASEPTHGLSGDG
jgi:hypothetical protein